MSELPEIGSKITKWSWVNMHTSGRIMARKAIYIVTKHALDWTGKKTALIEAQEIEEYDLDHSKVQSMFYYMEPGEANSAYPPEEYHKEELINYWKKE